MIACHSLVSWTLPFRSTVSTLPLSTAEPPGGSFAGGSGEGSAHAVVAGVKDQNGPSVLARGFPRRDHGGKTLEATAGAVVVEY